MLLIMFSAITCSTPATIPRTTMTIEPTSLSDSTHPYKARVVYTCNLGHRTEKGQEEATMTCGQAGEWFGPIFTCEGKTDN